MIVHINNKKDYFELLRFFNAVNFQVELTLEDWEVYKEDTCINVTRREVKEFSSIQYYKARGCRVYKYNEYLDLLLGPLYNFGLSIITCMVIQQKAQGNDPNIDVFIKNKYANKESGGFNWCDTIQGDSYWCTIINDKNLDIFNYVKASRIK
jgi:hypothetical protein